MKYKDIYNTTYPASIEAVSTSHNIISSMGYENTSSGKSLIEVVKNKTITYENIAIVNVLSFLNLNEFKNITRTKKIKGKLTRKSSSDKELSEKLNGLSPFDPSEYDSYTKEDFENLERINSGRLANISKKWL